MAVGGKTPVKVGLFFVGSFLALGIFLQVLSTRGCRRSDSYEISAVFDDVLGLERKSPVQIAGIDIGRIQSIDLVGGKAKVTLEIDADVALYEDATIEKVSISLLGDYKLAVDPGTSTRRLLKDGDQIVDVQSMATVDAIMGNVRKMSETMREMISGEPGQPSPLATIVNDVQATSAAARVVLEEVSANIAENTAALTRILNNIENFTGDLETISAGKDRDITVIVEDVRHIAASLRATSEAVEKMVVGRNQGEVDESVQSLRQTLENMNKTLEHIASISAKIDKGEGTVGKLINDSSVHDEVEETVEGINSVVGGLARLQTWVNLRTEYQFRTGAMKNYVQFILQPQRDKSYIFEVVDDPRGVKETVIEDVETTSPESGRAFQYRERRTTTRDALNFSLMFQKRIYWLGMRFGIIEGTGGVGADLYLLRDRLEVRFDLNRFGEDARKPRVKGLALLEIIPHIYMHGGFDDPFNAATVDYFLGLGLRFNDEDLKSLLFATGGAGSVN